MSMPKRLSEMALKQATGIVPFILSLFFVRFVETTSPNFKATYAVLGVPPWRKLKARDLYTKPAVEI